MGEDTEGGEMTLKTTAIISAITLLIGGGLGFYVSEKTHPVAPDPIVKPDVVPPKHEIIIQPQTDQQYRDAFNSPIEITRKLTGDLYAIAATDHYKAAYVTDKIIIPVVHPRFLIQADLYGGMINKTPFYMYGASFDYFYNSRVFFGGGFAGSGFGLLIRANAGIAFY